MANLRGFIGTSDTTIQVDDTTSLPTNNGVVQIESEKIIYTNASDKALFGCIRGALSTSAATHADKKPIMNLSDTIFNSGVLDFHKAEVPTNLITGLGIAKTGDRFTNDTTGDIYVNTGTVSAPVWTLVDSAGSGITALTGAVTASGSGSVAATIPLTSAHILVGNGSNHGTDMALSGDATLANTGAMTLATVNSNVGSFTSANITVDAKGRVTAAANGSGGSQVLPQILFNSKTSQDQTSSATYVAVGPSQAITLQKSTNKVRITASASVLAETNSAVGTLTIKRDSTDLAPSAGGLLQWGAGTVQAYQAVTLDWIDSPGDTSSHTYQVYVKSSSGLVDYGIAPCSTIVLEEILS